MARKIYCEGSRIAIAEYIAQLDDRSVFECWNSPATQAGYNFMRKGSFDDFRALPVRSRFRAIILRKPDMLPVGYIFLSPPDSEPDLAIMIYDGFRGKGYGTEAFGLTSDYCMEIFKLDHIYAGCYEGNVRSKRMLEKCGFVPHPEGNQLEKHYLTGEDIIQYDFVKRRQHRR